jgi:anti-sigma-K factor RskA
MNCEETEELIGVYVLGALVPEEHADVRDHLASCENHPEVVELQAIAASLAFATPAIEPSPALKARLMDAVSLESERRPRERARAGFLEWLGALRPQAAVPYALAGALAIAVVALVLTNIGRSDEGQTAVATLTGSGEARAVVYELENGVLVMQADGLEPLVDEQTYQVWGIDDQRSTSLGLLGPAPDGEALSAMRADLSSIDALAVTVEPAGGSPRPTTEPVLLAEDILKR